MTGTGAGARNVTDLLHSLDLITFAKKQCGCSSRAGWRSQLFPGGGLMPASRSAPAAESRVLGALGQGVQSEKQFYALFPSPSCPYWVWALVRGSLEFSLGTNTFKNGFRSLHSIQKVSGGLLYPLYLDLLGGGSG